jgi:flagellar hook capping protein FlgD
MEAYATSLIDCFFFDRNHGFAVGGTGSPAHRHAVILSTGDGGATWQTRYSANRPGAEWCWKISFPTPATGYVSIERPDGLAPTYVLKSMDGGMTWAEERFVDGYDEQGIGFASVNLGWVGGWGGNTYETVDGGASWHPAGFGFVMNRFRFLSPTLGYAVGQTVYKYTADPTAVDEGPAGAQALTLAQNRPNPVIHSTRIPFSLGAPAHVRVTIHDVQGRTLLTLFDGIRPAGRTELAWDARDRNGNRVGTGVYWCRIETPTRNAETKLLVMR